MKVPPNDLAERGLTSRRKPIERFINCKTELPPWCERNNGHHFQDTSAPHKTAKVKRDNIELFRKFKEDNLAGLQGHNSRIESIFGDSAGLRPSRSHKVFTDSFH
jgi:hypothetical protein